MDLRRPNPDETDVIMITIRDTWGRVADRGGPAGVAGRRALRALALLGLVGPPALQQGGQFLPEEDEEVM
jgi:hypothetical protein